MLSSRQIESLVARIEPDLIALRRRIHEHPELAFEERETARAVSDYLAALDIPHRRGVGKTGVVAMIEEASGVPFASRVPDPPQDLATIPKAQSRHRLAVETLLLPKSIMGDLHHEYSLAISPVSA